MENISKGTAKRIILKTISFKENSKEQYKKSFELLRMFKDDENNKFFYYHSMAKLLLKQRKYNDAKFYLLEEIYNGIEKPSTYYQLFKIDVYEKNYIDAYLDLFKFKEQYKTKEIDISLPLTLLEMCNDLNKSSDLFSKTDYYIPETNILFSEQFKDEAQKLYLKIIQDVNARKFNIARKDLTILNDLINEKNIKIDVVALIEILTYLDKKINTLYLEEFFKSKCLNKNIQLKTEILKTIRREGFSINTIIFYINKIIDLDLSSAKKAFERLQQFYNLEDFDYEIKHIQNRINENEEYLSLTDEQKTIYNLCLEKGKLSYNYFLEKALYFNEAGKFLTKLPIFDLEKAITLYNSNYYEEAKICLKDYCKTAGNEKFKALLILRSIAVKEQNVQEIIKIEEEMIRYKRSFEKTNKFVAIYTNFFDQFNIEEINENTKNEILATIKKENMSLKSILKSIESLSKIDPYTAEEMLNMIEKVYSFNNYEIVYSNLKNTLKENIDYLKLSDEERKMYITCKEKAKIAYQEEDYNLALDYYEAGKYITNHPYFTYRIGLCYYMMYDYDTAREYFLEYLAVGGKKEVLSLIFLSNIELNSKNIPMSVYYQNRSKKIADFYDKQDKTYLLERKFLKQKKSKKRKNRNNRKKEDQDVVKNKISKTLKMTTEEFTNDELDISLYDNYTLDQKLAIIKSLYQDKKIKTADKMIKELEKTTTDKEERKQITSERKRKLLYINQSKGRIDKR